MSQEGVQALGETRTVPSDRIMAVDAEIDSDYEEEVQSAKQRNIAQRKSLDMKVEAQLNQHLSNQQLSPLLTDKSTEPESNYCGEEMTVEVGDFPHE